jgi:hypothetical protein
MAAGSSTSLRFTNSEKSNTERNPGWNDDKVLMKIAFVAD